MENHQKPDMASGGVMRVTTDMVRSGKALALVERALKEAA